MCIHKYAHRYKYTDTTRVIDCPTHEPFISTWKAFILCYRYLFPLFLNPGLDFNSDCNMVFGFFFLKKCVFIAILW